MPGLSFPIRFECTNCKSRTVVKQPNALGLYANPRGTNAVEIALQKRGRIRNDIKGLLLPGLRRRERSNSPLTVSDFAMSDLDDANPYSNPKLREAFRWGWKAWIRDEPRPTDELYRESEKGQAWMDGYEAAEEQGATK